MLRSYLLGFLTPIVLVVAVMGGIASASTIGGLPAIGVMLAGVFVAGYLRYLSQHTTRIRR